MREAFRPATLSCADAIARAGALPGRPIVINETSDNPGGGAPGDGTHLLRALLDARVGDACFGCIADPEAARRAHAAGVGAKLELALGGKSDALHGGPLHVDAEVSALSNGRFTPRALLAGVELNLGPMARLRVGGIDVLVASRAQQTFDAEVFRVHGIDVASYKIVALKSSHHFRAGFESLASGILTADPPGLTHTAHRNVPSHAHTAADLAARRGRGLPRVARGAARSSRARALRPGVRRRSGRGSRRRPLLHPQ
jgi:microcystin degradation protein MlrC